MNRILALFCLSFLYEHCWAQRYDGMRTYDIIGLANGEEISDCISKGLPFLVVGLIIFYICIRKSKTSDKRKQRRKRLMVGMYKSDINRHKHNNNATFISMG